MHFFVKYYLIPLTVLILFFVNIVSARENIQFSITNNVLARPMAMGGAFLGQNDALSSTIYNPAAIGLYKYPVSGKFAFYVNPGGLYSTINDFSDINSGKKYVTRDYLTFVGSILKGVGYSRPAFSAVLLLSQDVSYFSYTNSVNNVLSAKNLFNNNFHVLAIKLKLAEQIAIGASSFIFSSTRNDSTIFEQGVSYGVYLVPTPMVSIGMVYYDLPAFSGRALMQQNRILDESINIGLVFRPVSWFSFALDAYNVAEESSVFTREIHTGFEFQPFADFILRGGFYREQDTGTDVLSAGMGIIDHNSYHSTDDSFIFKDFSLNYSFQSFHYQQQYTFRHIITFLLKF